MKVLLDECLPRKLKRELPGHEIVTVAEAGWSGIKNGALLRLAEANFDVFLTIDQNIPYQQNLKGRTIALAILVATDNRLPTLQPLIPQLIAALETIVAGDVVVIRPE